MIAMLRCGPSNRPFAATEKTEMAEFTHCGQSRRMGHLCQCLLRVECEKTRYRNYVMSGRQLLGTKYRYQPLHQMAESTGYYCQH